MEQRASAWAGRGGGWDLAACGELHGLEAHGEGEDVVGEEPVDDLRHPAARRVASGREARGRAF
eukprot:735122-Rhodomonas_salina.2